MLKKSLDDSDWILPPTETEGTIKEESSSEILGLKTKKDCTFGKKVSLQNRGEIKFSCDPASDSQLWFRSKNDADGYFTLKNIKNGQLLTSIGETKFKVTGMIAANILKILEYIFFSQFKLHQN